MFSSIRHRINEKSNTGDTECDSATQHNGDEYSRGLVQLVSELWDDERDGIDGGI